MRKKLIVITIFFCIVFQAMSEAPELRNVMPNSWQKVTRLTAEEEEAFIQENRNIIEEGIEKGDFRSRGYTYSENLTPRIYKQIVGSDIFYRIIITSERDHDFNERNAYFAQVLVYETNGRKKIIAFGEYNKRYASQYSSMKTYNSIEIIEAEGKAKGVLITALNTRVDDTGNYTKIVKGQAAGSSLAVYLFMEDLLKTENIIEQYFTPNNTGNMTPFFKNPIEITASECLVDPNIPLRYSLQNAFDGNPTTLII